jgi:hypothetical protein
VDPPIVFVAVASFLWFAVSVMYNRALQAVSSQRC